MWTQPLSLHSSIPPAFRSRLSVSTDLCVAAFLILTGMASIAGNSLVLLVLARKRKKLRPHEVMTINLAVCDFGYSLLGAPCFIISSISHGWVFGEAGCMLYGIQGFVFGIGSMLTTCLISLDRCFKICSLRYGQWIERRHTALAVLLLWVYTFFWASLPALGFGSYGPEPFGTSCTINWWRIKVSLNDRAYILLILCLCFCVPVLIIVTSYLSIFYMVYRSRHTLASISSTNKTFISKDLKLTKIALVVCSTFLLAWMPYAVVSLYTALTAREEYDVAAMPAALPLPGEGIIAGGGVGNTTTRLFAPVNILSIFNRTAEESLLFSPTAPPPHSVWGSNTTAGYMGSPWSAWGSAAFVPGSGPASGVGVTPPQVVRAVSSLAPEVSLIPTMFAKAHSFMNPFIYQFMNCEFRRDVYRMLGLRYRAQRKSTARSTSFSNGKQSSIALSHHHSWRERSRSTLSMVSLRELSARRGFTTKELESSHHRRGFHTQMEEELSHRSGFDTDKEELSRRIELSGTRGGSAVTVELSHIRTEVGRGLDHHGLQLKRGSEDLWPSPSHSLSGHPGLTRRHPEHEDSPGRMKTTNGHRHLEDTASNGILITAADLYE